MRRSDTKRKYSWVVCPFDDWLKSEAVRAKNHGFQSSTSDISNRLLNEIIIPNDIKFNWTPPKHKKIKL